MRAPTRGALTPSGFENVGLGTHWASIGAGMAEQTEPATGASPQVVGTRSVDIVVYLLLLGLAALLGYDNWRSGASWEADGPQSGYFPFYLSLLLAAASLFGLA